MSLANLVQQRDERLVLLAIDVRELDSHVVNLLQRLRAEEIWCVVVGFQHALILGRDNGRELCQVANHQQLHAAKGLSVFTKTAQHGIDGVEQVGTHHRYFVDDEQVA